MRVAVIGGTGTLGRLVVGALTASGDEVRVLSRSAASLPAGATHHPIDLRTGDGLASALDEVDAVVDAANATSKAKDVLVAGTRRVLEAGRAAGVGHHLLISIVGCDRVPIGYYRAKTAQERVLGEGAVPWSLLRATQFHPLLDGLFSTSARFGVSPRMRVPVQPIDPQVVADRLAAAVHAGPGGRLPDLAGPRIERADELAAIWARTTGRRRLPLPIPLPGKVGRALRDEALCAREGTTEGLDFAGWLRTSVDRSEPS